MLARANQPYEKSLFDLQAEDGRGGQGQGEGAGRAHCEDAEQKLFYLAQHLESIRTTFFRQVQFAEFQLQMHEIRERGQPLSGASLTESYCALLKRFYGEAEGIMRSTRCTATSGPTCRTSTSAITWQYATSMQARPFAEEMQGAKSAQARDRFVAMLKAGGSDDPYEVPACRVDLGNRRPIRR
jgi:oligoendopeptidase F